MWPRAIRPTAVDKYRDANRALWEEWAAINYGSDFYRVDEFKKGVNKLRPIELEEIGSVAGKSLLHLQCHFGMDTLSWARLGADVTGVDFSEAAIARARDLARELRINASFIRSDVYDLPRVLHERFDIVYTSRGVLGWLPDIEAWAQVAASCVRPGGFFYITEIHPIAQVFNDDEGVTELKLRYPYFSQAEPLAFPTQGSYADRMATVEQEYEYGWNHGLGEIVSALAGAGLRIEYLHEFPFNEWQVSFLHPTGDGTYRLPPDDDGKLPLSFSLKALKPGL